MRRGPDGVLEEGAEVGSYRIRRAIGRGGFGITYVADNRLGLKAAIKEFRPDQVMLGDSADPEEEAERQKIRAWALKKFEDTTLALARFDHPNIVKVRDYIPGDGTGYMFMDLVEGEAFSQVLRRRPILPLADVGMVLGPIAEALGYLHARGVVHRDVKPDNIMIRADGTPVLIDFGSLKAIESDMSRAAGDKGLTPVAPTTMLQTYLVFSPEFAAPEQRVPDAEITPATDIYALAAVAYRALTGEPVPDADRRASSLAAGRVDPYRSVRTIWPPSPQAASDRVVATIDAALSLNPRNRPQSAAEFLAGMGWDNSPTATKPTALASAPPAASSRWRIPALAAAALIAVAGMAGGWFWHGERQAHAARLTEAAYDTSALARFIAACGTLCPGALREEAMERQSRIAAEAAAYRALPDDAERLRAYAQDCKACEFKPAAMERVEKIERERREAEEQRQAAERRRLAGLLASAGSDMMALSRFAMECGPSCPEDFVAQAQRRIASVMEQRRKDEELAEQRRKEELARQEQRRREEAALAERRRREEEARAEQRRRDEIARQEEAVYRAARGDQSKLRAYLASCGTCAFRDAANAEIQTLQREDGRRQDEAAYRAARGDVAKLRAYAAGCALCAFRDAANSEIETLQRDDAARREANIYQQARGDAAKLRAYVTSCVVCAFRDAANGEIATIQRDRLQAERATREEERYRSARGDLAKLKDYLAACEVCAFSGDARTEIASLEKQDATFTFKVCNKSGSKASVATFGRRETNGSWMVEGWFVVEPGDCDTIGQWAKGAFYYMAVEYSNYKSGWRGRDIRLCVTHERFERANTPNYSCGRNEILEGFFKKDITAATFTWTLNP